MSKYYIPSVSEDGILTWTPTEEGMPEVEAVNILGPEGKVGIRGPQGVAGLPGADGTVAFENLTDTQLAMITGPRGPSGVYVGPLDPGPQNVQIWVDSDEKLTTTLATIEYVDLAVTTHQPSVDLTNYATKEYVQTAVSQIPGMDLTKYYTKTETNALLNNTLSRYATIAFVNEAIAAGGGSGADLSNYATKDYVANQISAAAPDLTQYYKKTETYNTSEVYTKTEIDHFFAAWAANQGIPASEGVIY